MAETCIVCLGDLRTEIAEEPPPPDAPATGDIDIESPESIHATTTSKCCTRTQTKSLDADEETIAHLLPCKHDLHNACLKPWVERANSCPICRTTFNMVELSRTVGGEVQDSYSVQDKRQEAELDASMVVDDELFAIEVWEPCMLCGVGDDTHALMYCDGCDKAVHVFCAGFDEAQTPEIWYCNTCLLDMEGDARLPGMASALGRQPRRRVGAFQRRSGRRNNDAVWARVWQEVSRRIDLDLDFPFDEEVADERTPEQRAEFRRWERRFAEVNRQGATNRLQDVAAANIQSSRPDPESQEEIRAWNAFDKARASQDEPQNARRNKRKATESPASPKEQEMTEQRQLKRPRLRKPRTVPEPAPVAESSTSAQNNNTFLSFLLKEVENKPVSAGSPSTSDLPNGQWSPRNSSPVRSPTSSGYVTPRALSVTPPPQRPVSPPAGGRAAVPAVSSPLAATYSPFSPSNFSQDIDQNGLRHRGRRRHIHDSPAYDQFPDKSPARDRASSKSPSRALSYSTKEEIQRMVKAALGPRYQNNEITKDQYTNINRNVSRKLYELVGDASALSNQTERGKWQSIAEGEVQDAIEGLGSSKDSRAEEVSPASE
ncbi:Hypothetical protein R9X50_00599500 [Acrodontium crateriforme]|uniref:RING-type domain-containing protein n=1 Tax=Acrodontium crateriforme TaxID=150365 RepID=A0AAQ3RBX4_9PEZI|nr:Hypothetical protein R9X50_00599500 [Acrodontium crateriforme]